MTVEFNFQKKCVEENSRKYCNWFIGVRKKLVGLIGGQFDKNGTKESSSWKG